MGSSAVRALLVRAAITFMRGKATGDSLGQWTAEVERRSGKLRSRVALARKLAVIMLAMWKSGQSYQPTRHPANDPQFPGLNAFDTSVCADANRQDDFDRGSAQSKARECC